MAIRDDQLTTTLDFDFSDNSGVSTVAAPYVADVAQQTFDVGLGGMGHTDDLLHCSIEMTEVMADATAGSFQIGIYQDAAATFDTGPTLLALSPLIALPADGDIVYGPSVPINTARYIAVIPVWAGNAGTGECSATIFFSPRLVNDGS